MKKKLYILLILCLISTISYGTYSAFVVNVVKTGTINTKELSTKFLDDTSFLAKIQELDSTITSVDKTTDLTRELNTPTVTLTDNNIVSTNDSSVPIYLWIDNGTIYYYTVATNIDLNTN